MTDVMPAAAIENATERVNVLLVDDQPGKLLVYEAILADLGVAADQPAEQHRDADQHGKHR